MSYTDLMKMKKTEGHAIIRRLQAIDSSTYILKMNLTEFRDSVRLYEKEDELWYFQNRKELELFQLEVARRVHNYVASWYSLYYHCKRYRDVLGDEFIEEYKIKFLDFSDGIPEVNFVKVLRNYLQHYNIPPIQTSVEVKNGVVKKTIQLSKQELLDYQGINVEVNNHPQRRWHDVRLKASCLKFI